MPVGGLVHVGVCVVLKDFVLSKQGVARGLAQLCVWE